MGGLGLTIFIEKVEMGNIRLFGFALSIVITSIFGWLPQQAQGSDKSDDAMLIRSIAGEEVCTEKKPKALKQFKKKIANLKLKIERSKNRAKQVSKLRRRLGLTRQELRINRAICLGNYKSIGANETIAGSFFGFTSPTSVEISQLPFNPVTKHYTATLKGFGFSPLAKLALLPTANVKVEVWHQYINESEIQVFIPGPIASTLKLDLVAVVQYFKFDVSTLSIVATSPFVVQLTNGQNSASKEGKAPIGINLEPVEDFSATSPFTNMMKASRDWISGGTNGDWNNGLALAKDSQGWIPSLLPGQTARTLINWDLPICLYQGKYTLMYKGEGILQLSGGIQTLPAESTPGYVVFQSSPASPHCGIQINITSTNPSNYIRDIVVVRDGGSCSSDQARFCKNNSDCSTGDSCLSFKDHYEDRNFDPDYLKALSSFDTIRFMNWGRINNHPHSDWSLRAKPTDARYTSSKGVPLEIMVRLANTLKVNPWFTLPHLATAQYIDGYAQIIRDTLYPELYAYIEYSNEVWNSQFMQSQYAKEQGLALGLSSNAFQAQLRYYALKSTEMFKRFETVFAGQMNRISRVLATQAGNQWTTEQVVTFADTAAHSDAVAIAPYFGGAWGSSGAKVQEALALGLDGLLDALEIEVLSKGAQIEGHKNWATQHSLKLVAYEGGQHLVGVWGNENNAELTKLFVAANKDQRMADLYKLYFDIWFAHGGKLFAFYRRFGVYSKWGSWGLQEYQNQPLAQTPKLQAIIELQQEYGS